MAELTPMMKQYNQMKAEHPDCIPHNYCYVAKQKRHRPAGQCLCGGIFKFQPYHEKMADEYQRKPLKPRRAALQ